MRNTENEQQLSQQQGALEITTATATRTAKKQYVSLAKQQLCHVHHALL